jgi:hypothetical protein
MLDLFPVRLRRTRGPGVRRRDRRLQLKRARTLMAQGFVDENEPLGDELAIPEAAILIFQQHDRLVASSLAVARAC